MLQLKYCYCYYYVLLLLLLFTPHHVGVRYAVIARGRQSDSVFGPTVSLARPIYIMSLVPASLPFLQQRLLTRFPFVLLCYVNPPLSHAYLPRPSLVIYSISASLPPTTSTTLSFPLFSALSSTSPSFPTFVSLCPHVQPMQTEGRIAYLISASISSSKYCSQDDKTFPGACN